MAGSTILWKCTFLDDCNNECIVQIGSVDYDGATTEVEGGAAPVIIRWLGEGDSKYTHIKASEAVIEFVSTTSLQYLGLFLATNKTYFVQVYRGGGLLFWSGWINPEYYQEPFAPVPYITTITATDALAELKNIAFPIPSYTTFKHSLITYIATCLKQISVSMNAQIYVSLHLSATTTADGIVTSRLLEYLYADYRTMRDEEDLWKCWDILNEILATLNARVYQAYGNWIIERIQSKIEEYDYEVYDLDGVYVTTSTQAWTTELTAHVGWGTDIRFINDPATLEVQPASKKFIINHEYGNRQNILKSSNFDGNFYEDDFTTETDLRYWDEDTGDEVALVKKVQLPDFKVLSMEAIPYAIGQVPSFKAFIQPIETGAPASPLVWTYNEGGVAETDFVNWIYGTGACYLKYSVFGNTEIFSESEPKLKSFVRIGINCSGTTYYAWSGNGISLNYDTSLYEWVEATSGSPTTYSFRHFTTVCRRGEWTDVTIELRFPEAEQGNTQTYVGFIVAISSPNLNQLTMGEGRGIYYKKMQLYFSDELDEDKIEVHTNVISEDNILEPDEYEIKFAESPAPYDSDGYGLVNRYVLFDSGGAAVNGFGGVTNTPPYPMPQYSLVRQVINWDMLAQYRIPQFKLRGAIINTTLSNVWGMDFRTVLKDYNDRYYFPTGLEYNVKHCTFGGEWVQFHDESGTTGEFNDDFNEDFWI